MRPMEPAEIAFLVGILFVFYITVKHPFFIATLILLFIILRYFADTIQVESKFSGKEDDLNYTTLNRSGSNESQSEETTVLRKKSQREILAEVEATEPPPKEKFSKLLLTYQVPTMTEYYERLVQFIQN